MLTASLIAKKRQGAELADDEIRGLIAGFCDGSVADYQMSALAMAICLNGMSPRETTTLTQAMLESGETLPRHASGDRPRVDKHSTGGLGDKVSLILAPLLAACEVHVPMISGRGLGLTGGTLDKLESIPGFRTGLSVEESSRVLEQVGAFIVSASERIAPADRRLYALRDVTGTIESISLITASILSKKLAANLDALVIDVKVGGGAFMKSLDDAQALASSLERVGSQAGLTTTSLISDMDQPLGQAIGNAIEVNEALTVLSAERRDEAAIEAVRELTLQLGAPLLVAVDAAEQESEALGRLAEALDDGSGRERLQRMIAAQGGTWQDELPLAAQHTLSAPRDGFVTDVDCQRIGEMIVALGGGRRQVGDPIDHSVGLSLLARVGDEVQRDQPLMQLHCHPHQRDEALRQLADAVTLGDEPVATRPLTFPRS